MEMFRFKQDVAGYLESLQVAGGPYGCYRFKPGGRGGEPGFYATADVAILRTVWGEDLQASLTPEQRGEWIGHINSFADQDGTYRAENHTPHHRNGMAIGALGPLGGRQACSVSLYRDFDTVEKVIPWLERMEWDRQWGGSHLFWGGIHCYSMSDACSDDWRAAVFDWLDRNLDPQTGWWRRGVEHLDTNQPLGGGAHIWPIYQHHGRRFPYPERVIDSILAMQRPNGKWIGTGSYLDLDALYGLAYMRELAPDHRPDDIRAAANRHGDLLSDMLSHYLATGPDTHQLLARVSTLGLLQQLLPDRFKDAVFWTDIFSDIRLYDTKAVECVG